jgi:hypothetical protein
MQDLDACDGVDTATSPTTITATRMGRSVGLNTAAAEIARASDHLRKVKTLRVQKSLTIAAVHVPERIALAAGRRASKNKKLTSSERGGGPTFAAAR